MTGYIEGEPVIFFLGMSFVLECITEPLKVSRSLVLLNFRTNSYFYSVAGSLLP